MLFKKENIIESIKKFNNFYNITFYQQIIEYFNKSKLNNLIKENEYELIGYIIHLFINPNKYNLGIKINSKPIKNSVYRHIKLNNNQELNNLLYTLGSNFFFINYKSNSQNNNKYDIYICIDSKRNKNINYHSTPSKVDLSSLTQMFGIENFNIIKYINLPRFKKLKKRDEGINSLTQLNNYINLIKNSSDYEQYSCCVLSSMILFIIGTTTALDVDPMIYNTMNNQNINSLSHKMGEKEIDYIELNKDNIWYSEKSKSYAYWMTYAISTEWPQSVGASSIEDIFFNSKYHFYMYGIKFISLDLQIERLLKRNSPIAYVDLYVLKLYNKPNLKLPCSISKVQSRVGKTVYIDEESYNIMISKIKHYLAIWHNINIDIDELKKIFVYCESLPYNKYSKKVNTYGLFLNLRKFHQYIKEYFLEKYCNNCTLLVDVGSGHLKNLRFWKKYNIQKIIALEPSKDFYNFGLKKQKGNIFAQERITFIRAVGEKNWLSGNAGLDNNSKKLLINLKNIKACCITFEFSIHYMIYKIETLMKNILSISTKDTKIIIHTLNGDFIRTLLTTTNKYSVYKNNDEVFYIEKKYKETNCFKKINIYFKGAQGLNNIVTEYIVDSNILINTFLNNDFKLLEFTKFLDHNIEEFKLDEYEFNVSNLYLTYVFSKN
jgi:hypothetical protein